MAHTYSSLWYHLVFGTHQRVHRITPALKKGLYPYMGGILRELGGRARIINGTADHIHILASVPPRLAVAEAVRKVKANSTRWVREQGGEGRSFGWQNGYSAFTLAPSDMEGLMEYISRQEEHPRTTTFEEELRALLQAHGLEWDEKYGWD